MPGEEFATFIVSQGSELCYARLAAVTTSNLASWTNLFFYAYPELTGSRLAVSQALANAAVIERAPKLNVL